MMEQVETDLNKSKQLREKEFSRQFDELTYKQERELQEMKMTFDNEKAQLLRDFHLQKDNMQSEHERDMDTLKEQHCKEMQEVHTRFGTRHEKDSKTISDFETQIRELREKLVQSNQLRKQQLVELGLIRKEENKKMQRDHEAEVSRFRSELEQQRLELHKTHSTEMENMLEKTNQTLKNIYEREYRERGQKSTELQEMKMTFDNEKAQLLRDFHLQKDYMQSEHERDMDTLKEQHCKEMQEVNTRFGTRHEKDSKTISDFETQIRELRERLVQSNQVRKQQLVELGLIRKEENKKMQRDHEAEVSRFRSELEQQRLELHKTHITEMENMLEKTNQTLKNIEREYRERGQKSTEN